MLETHLPRRFTRRPPCDRNTFSPATSYGAAGLCVALILAAALLSAMPSASAQEGPAHALSTQTGFAQVDDEAEFDEEFPPGDPVIDDQPGDNPVVGNNAPANETNYLRLVIIALGLILAGVVLVKLEGWERRRSGRVDD